MKSSARSGRRGDRSPCERSRHGRGCKSARSHGDSKRWISSGSKNRAAHSGRDAAHNEETETEMEPETDKQHQEQGQEEEEEGAARYTKSSSL